MIETKWLRRVIADSIHPWGYLMIWKHLKWSHLHLLLRLLIYWEPKMSKLKKLVMLLKVIKKIGSLSANTVKRFKLGRIFSGKTLRSESEMSRQIWWQRSTNLWTMWTMKKRRMRRLAKNMWKLCKVYLKSQKVHGVAFRDKKSRRMRISNRWKNTLTIPWAETRKISKNFIGNELSKTVIFSIHVGWLWIKKHCFLCVLSIVPHLLFPKINCFVRYCNPSFLWRDVCEK